MMNMGGKSQSNFWQMIVNDCECNRWLHKYTLRRRENSVLKTIDTSQDGWLMKHSLENCKGNR
ncbi:hypothetical protein B4O97_16265 [Marispirochaeta aestuarii]|uniref:Uncharacterized protein n=1 Tax=Marispirochaeta aestuarii TaxID=1963862 RepID=A0A1Y1RUC1_9SPIO|nr:hypothetical protein B4O97_16265 [Marispirochaeta aestuarii]